MEVRRTSTFRSYILYFRQPLFLPDPSVTNVPKLSPSAHVRKVIPTSDRNLSTVGEGTVRETNPLRVPRSYPLLSVIIGNLTVDKY